MGDGDDSEPDDLVLSLVKLKLLVGVVGDGPVFYWHHVYVACCQLLYYCVHDECSVHQCDYVLNHLRSQMEREHNNVSMLYCYCQNW